MSPIDGFAPPLVAPEVLERVASGSYHDPHSVLGQHLVDAGVADPLTVIRALRPLAAEVQAVFGSDARVELAHIGHGLWEGYSILGLRDYEIEARYDGGAEWKSDDPYRYAPTIGELDLHLIGEGRHEELWRVLGAHYRPHAGVSGSVHGTSFAVWAPHAQAVRVIGDLNQWNGVGHAMRNMGATGVWELFVPGLEPGSVYKYEILTQSGDWVQRADPMASAAELPPQTGSVISQSAYSWDDGDWMRARRERDPHNAPMSVYELHLGSWRPGLGYRDAAEQLIEYVNELGFTHVEFMPLAEHPFGGSWGYQVTGYYAPTSRFGSPDDLRYLIDRLHQAGIGVLMDWVPGHFPKDEWALANFDGAPLYEHPDPRRGEQKDWSVRSTR